MGYEIRHLFRSIVSFVGINHSGAFDVRYVRSSRYFSPDCVPNRYTTFRLGLQLAKTNRKEFV